MTEDMKTDPSIFCGIDFGTHACVVSSSDATAPYSIGVDVNNLANRATPSYVAFENGLRVIGEEAEGKFAANPKSVLAALPLWLSVGTQDDIDDTIKRGIIPNYKPCLIIDENHIARLEAPDLDAPMSVMQLVGHYINKLAGFALTAKNGCIQNTHLVFAVPDDSTPVFIRNLFAALQVHHITPHNTTLLNQSDATINCWASKNLPKLYTEICAPQNKKDFIVGFVDIGFSRTCVTFVQISKTTETEKNESENELTATLLSKKVAHTVGTNVMIYRMMEHMKEMVKKRAGSKMNEEEHTGFKYDLRLFNHCAKLVRDLSGLADVTVDLESVYPTLAESMSLEFHALRSEFEENCTELIVSFNELFKSAVSEAEENISNGFKICVDTHTQSDTYTQDTHTQDAHTHTHPETAFIGVEISGGGTRVPFIQQCVCECVGVQCIRRTIDGSAAASMGAALYAAGSRWVEHMDTSAAEVLQLQPQVISMLQEEESSYGIKEIAEHERRHIRNELESYILHTQNCVATDVFLKQHKKNESINSWLLDVENWMYDTDPVTTTTEEYKAKLSEIDAKMHEEVPEYFEHLEKEKQIKEEEMKKYAREMEVDKEDHDNRKLPNSARLERARKNKDEGNELFQGQSYELAIQRYIKTLGHTSKMFDTKPEEEEERKVLDLACHLNLAQCYLKLDGEIFAKKAKSSALSALQISPDNNKALFRHAMAEERLADPDSALRIIRKVLKSEPDNADAKKVQERLEIHLAKQQENRKKMYSKMFP